MDQEAEKERKPQKHLLNPVLKSRLQQARSRGPGPHWRSGGAGRGQPLARGAGGAGSRPPVPACALTPTGQSATPLQGVLTVSGFVALSCLTLRAKLRGIREGKESGCVFIRDTASMQEKGVESATASKQH